MLKIPDNIQMIDLKFVDFLGRWHHLTVPVEQAAGLFDTGIGFDGSAVGFRPVFSGDMTLLPDPATGVVDPFCEVPTFSFICNACEADTRAPYLDDPRGVAQRAEAHLRELGVGDESRWGPEFEFYVFDDVSFENDVFHSSYVVSSRERIPLHAGYHAIPPLDHLHDFRTEVSLHLAAMNVPVKYHHHEVGGPGQVELEIPLAGLLQAADMGMTVKYVARMVAARRGQSVTFMPKPLYGEAGSGMHCHQQIFKNGCNLFYDPNGYGLLSETARYYIGGLLLHAPALLGLTNPSTNSYRRLVPGFEAPVSAIYSLGNRSAAVRIPKYATQPDAVRMEFRPPDATGNLYYTLAAQLMAGLDGIRRRIDPTEQGFGPMDEDVFTLSPDRLSCIRQLPVELEDALTALENDHEFLLAGGVFSCDLIERWIARKREKELKEVRMRPHPYEVMLYYDV